MIVYFFFTVSTYTVIFIKKIICGVSQKKIIAFFLIFLVKIKWVAPKEAVQNIVKSSN